LKSLLGIVFVSLILLGCVNASKSTNSSSLDASSVETSLIDPASTNQSSNISLETEKETVADVLDTLHWAASLAQKSEYFDVFSERAIYIGTDVSEVWTLEQFKQFVEPYFDRGQGWTYVPQQRNVYISRDGRVAWFDEVLWNEKYGTSRGTGVLEKESGRWKIVQYHLTFPIPNAIAKKITQEIKDFSKTQ